MNAKLEFLAAVRNLKVRCAKISLEIPNYLDEEASVYTPAFLPLGYSQEQYNEFLKILDFDYDHGYGSQELFGTIWCTDGKWFDRYEYDGSECWNFHHYPDIPEDLQGNEEKTWYVGIKPVEG